MKKKGNIILIISIFTLMALIASAENIINIFIPLFRKEFSIDNTNIGTMISFGSLGYIIFTFIGGLLCEKVGQKKVFIFGILSIMLSMIMYSFTSTYLLLLIDMFLLNVGLSLVSIAINTLVPVLVLSFQAILMNLTHFCYGLGSAIGQGFASILYGNGVNWRSIYGGLGVIFGLILLVFIFIKIPEAHKVDDVNKTSFKESIKDKMVIYYIIALGFYVFAEIGTFKWFVNYVNDTYHYTETQSGIYITVFTVIFTIGRLVGGFVVEKFGYLNTVIKSLLLACILYTMGLIIGENGLILISISGLFFAITFPTMVTSISKVFKNKASSITGIVVTFASSINMIFNLLIGKLNDKIGTHNALYIIPVSLIISICFTYLIYSKSKLCFDK